MSLRDSVTDLLVHFVHMDGHLLEQHKHPQTSHTDCDETLLKVRLSTTLTEAGKV